MYVRPLLRLAALVGIVTTCYITVFREAIGLTDFTSMDERILFGAQVVEYRDVQIIGDEDFIRRTEEALDYIAEKDPESYELVWRNISGAENNGFAALNPSTRHYSIGDATVNSGLEPYASMIVHDACHVKLARKKEMLTRMEEERLCLEDQNTFLQRIGYPLIDIDAALETRYWEIYPLFRNW
ncbi:MAG: hypothetical protein J4428_05190 [Candidatus Aenigmarchaeota archaeon]|nr:hypothetical protein [Candidatus Aenigmarchaeota archaeon]